MDKCAKGLRVLITRKAVYGLMAMKYLAERRGAGAISSSKLAGTYGLPQETLAKVLQHLAEAGFLVAHHGVKGGYTLGLDPDSISLLDVIRASGTPVPRSRPFTMVDQTIEKVLDRMTLVDMIEDNEDAGAHREGEASRFQAHILNPYSLGAGSNKP
jgi:Iron-dependent Transcriptional regulator